MTASPVENILITGAQGMIGSALQQYLSASGYKVFSLDRRSTNAHFHYVESTHRVFLDPTVPLSAVINLAGSNIADGRWTTSNVEKNEAILMQHLADRAIAAVGTIETAAYNAPFTPPFMRRNELMLEVVLDGASYPVADSSSERSNLTQPE